LGFVKNKMKSAENLLKILGIKFFTARHVHIIDDCLEKQKSGHYHNDEHVKKMLDQLGEWNAKDLTITKDWINEK
jgi:predicted metal-dependent HD superfamily phosphohydrolase